MNRRLRGRGYPPRRTAVVATPPVVGTPTQVTNVTVLPAPAPAPLPSAPAPTPLPPTPAPVARPAPVPAPAESEPEPEDPEIKEAAEKVVESTKRALAPSGAPMKEGDATFPVETGYETEESDSEDEGNEMEADAKKVVIAFSTADFVSPASVGQQTDWDLSQVPADAIDAKFIVELGAVLAHQLVPGVTDPLRSAALSRKRLKKGLFGTRRHGTATPARLRLDNVAFVCEKEANRMDLVHLESTDAPAVFDCALSYYVREAAAGASLSTIRGARLSGTVHAGENRAPVALRRGLDIASHDSGTQLHFMMAPLQLLNAGKARAVVYTIPNETGEDAATSVIHSVFVVYFPRGMDAASTAFFDDAVARGIAQWRAYDDADVDADAMVIDPSGATLRDKFRDVFRLTKREAPATLYTIESVKNYNARAMSPILFTADQNAAFQDYEDLLGFAALHPTSIPRLADIGMAAAAVVLDSVGVSAGAGMRSIRAILGRKARSNVRATLWHLKDAQSPLRVLELDETTFSAFRLDKLFRKKKTSSQSSITVLLRASEESEAPLQAMPARVDMAFDMTKDSDTAIAVRSGKPGVFAGVALHDGRPPVAIIVWRGGGRPDVVGDIGYITGMWIVYKIV